MAQVGFFHLQYDGFWSLIGTNGANVDTPIIAKTPRRRGHWAARLPTQSLIPSCTNSQEA